MRDWNDLPDGTVAARTPEKKHGALPPQKPLRLIRDGEVGGSGIFMSNTHSSHCHHQNDSALRCGGSGIFVSKTYSLHCHHHSDSAIKVGSCVSHLNVSLPAWATTKDSVDKPPFLKRKE